ncbi:MAG: dienelactone hydrolase family protein [Chloroflexia bacterium]|nr:dienelactone hydrolase family protein [Chloroflexia bacterium]
MSPILIRHIMLLSLLLLAACSGPASPTPPAIPTPPAEPTAPVRPTALIVVQAPTAPGVYGFVLESQPRLAYTIAIPDGYDPTEASALVVALHYEWNGDRPPQFYGGGLLSGLVLPALEEPGTIMVAPDCPGEDWANPQGEQTVLDLVGYLQAAYRIDPARIVLLGYSLGAEGAWYIAARNAGLFCAAIAISGRPHPQTVEQIEHTPLYIIHSRQDERFPLAEIETVVEQLKSRRAPIQLAVVEEATHGQLERFVQPLQEAQPWVQSKCPHSP